MSEARSLGAEWIHLGLGAIAQPQPAFTGMEWYEGYSQRTVSDGAEGRLVSQHDFTQDWDVWEMHPVGAEVVICTRGEIVLIQEVSADPDPVTRKRVTLRSGEYAINPPGVWHTADIEKDAQAIFITAGAGTEHRPR